MASLTRRLLIVLTCRAASAERVVWVGEMALDL